MADSPQREKIVGYIIIVSVLLITLVIGVALARYFVAPRQYITVYLPRIGELKTEDPFMVQGIKVGEVVSYSEDVYKGVSVQIKLYRNIPIYRGYQIYCDDIGLIVSKRQVVFINGPESDDIIEDRHNLRGAYYIGLTEVITSISKLKDGMDMLGDMLERYLQGDPTALGLFSKIEELTESRAELYEQIASVNQFFDSNIVEIIGAMRNITDQTAKLSNQFDRELPEAQRKINTILSSLETASVKIATTTADIDSVVALQADFDSDDITDDLITELRSLAEKVEDVRINARQWKLILQDYE